MTGPSGDIVRPSPRAEYVIRALCGEIKPVRRREQLPSVDNTLIVSHRAPRVTLHRRDSSGWIVAEFGPSESLELSRTSVKTSVDALYLEGLEDANAAR